MAPFSDQVVQILKDFYILEDHNEFTVLQILSIYKGEGLEALGIGRTVVDDSKIIQKILKLF